jgi:hypothetical protein
MRRNLIAFAAAFLLAAGVGTALTGCWSSDCNCSPTPARPEVQRPLAGLKLKSYDTRGELADLAVKPEGGSVEVTGDTIVFLYQQDGVHHRVVYEVTGPHGLLAEIAAP